MEPYQKKLKGKVVKKFGMMFFRVRSF